MATCCDELRFGRDNGHHCEGLQPVSNALIACREAQPSSMVPASLQEVSRSSYLRRLLRNLENRNPVRRKSTARGTDQPPQPKRR